MDSHEEQSFAQNEYDERMAAIRELNDRLRVQRKGGQLFVTHGVCSLGEPYVPAMIGAVIDFDEFSAENDPYGEHDFGALEVLGHKICWKIDYFDEHMDCASPDPADANVTSRVLTIMLASEY